MSNKKPNVILILCDQMRGDAFGADGNPCISTPNIDHLAACGTRFRCAYSAVPSCLPARAVLWTGQDQWHAGLLGMGWGQGLIPNDYPHTLPGELTQAGYRTHMVGKGHFHPQRTLMGFESTCIDESGRTLINGFKDDYREWFDSQTPEHVSPDDHGIDWNAWQARPWHTAESLHPTAWTMTAALDFIKQHDQEQPFFLNISFARPHSPYVPPQPYFERYMNADLPTPALGEWSSWHDDPQTARNVNAWRGKMKLEDIRRARAGYYGEISFIDTQIGRLLNWLRRFRPDMYRNTWFLFTSDHGDMQGDHHLWRKTYAYEGSARIPFLVVPPLGLGKPERAVADEVVELRDVMPTILAACGVAPPATVDGRAVLGLMREPDDGWRRYIHGEHCKCYSLEQDMQYVTDGKRKYIWFPRIDREQFFNLETDPGECHDLSTHSAHAAEVAAWRGYLVDELRRRDCGWVRDGKLHCPLDEPLVSPWRDLRREGAGTIQYKPY